MALYALGDLHLSFQADKTMDIFGRVWRHHERKIDYALVGTKGFTFEGPFYLNRRGEIIGWDEEREAHARKLVARETERLRDSFDQAEKAGFRKFIMFLHYPRFLGSPIF